MGADFDSGEDGGDGGGHGQEAGDGGEDVGGARFWVEGFFEEEGEGEGCEHGGGGVEG